MLQWFFVCKKNIIDPSLDRKCYFNWTLLFCISIHFFRTAILPLKLSVKCTYALINCKKDNRTSYSMDLLRIYSLALLHKSYMRCCDLLSCKTRFYAWYDLRGYPLMENRNMIMYTIYRIIYKYRVIRNDVNLQQNCYICCKECNSNLLFSQLI